MNNRSSKQRRNFQILFNKSTVSPHLYRLQWRQSDLIALSFYASRYMYLIWFFNAAFQLLCTLPELFTGLVSHRVNYIADDCTFFAERTA